jgi:hypothetical protein
LAGNEGLCHLCITAQLSGVGLVERVLE